MIQIMWARYGENSRKIVAERILGKIDNNVRNSDLYIEVENKGLSSPKLT